MGKVVEAVAIGVIVGVGLATGGFGLGLFAAWSTMAAVGVGAAAMSVSMTLMMKTPSTTGYTSQSERKQVLRSSASPKTVIYGKTVSAGTLIFAEEQAGEQVDGEWVHLVIAIAGHKLHGIGTIWLGDSTIDTYGEYVSYELINDAQTVNQFLLDNCPSWKSDMIGKGCALLRISLKFNADKFPAGIPNIKLEKLGRECYDPRDGVTKYSNNAALVILDYYRNYLYAPDSELLWDYWKEAANICDEIVTNSDGTTEPRYTINGEFDLSETKTKVLDDMLLACAGDPVYIGGKHGLMVGAYYGPKTIDLFDYQISGDISITPESSMTDRINTVTGKFVDPEQSYADTDFPAVTVDAWVEADGGEIKEDVTYRFVTSEWQAQRLANIKLRLKRYGRTIKVPMNMSGFAYRPGRYVNLYIKSLGIDGHTFRIRDWDFHQQNGCSITLRDEPPEVYDDAIGAELIRSALTSLPTGSVAMPDNLQFVTEQIGDVVQGRLTWTNTGTITVNNVIIRRDGTTVLTAQAPGQSCQLSGLPSGQYTAEVRAVVLTGAQSPAAAVSFVIATPSVPVAVNIEAANWSLELRPVFATAASFGTLCEFFFSTVNVPLASVEATATNLGLAAYLVHTGLQPDTEYHYWIRAVNAYGKSAFYPLTARTAYDPASLIAVLENQIGAEQLREELRTKIGKIDNIAVNAAAIQQIAVDLSALDARDSEATALLQAVQSQLGQNYIDTNLLYAQINQQVLAYKTQVENITNAILSIDPATGQITIDAINVAKADLELKITQVNQRVDGVLGTLSQKASQVTVDAQGQRLSTAETRLDAISDEITNQVTRAEFTETTEDVTQLTTRMSAAEGALLLKATQQSVNDVSTRVSTAEQQLTAVNDDLQSKAQAISQISSAYQAADEENAAAITELSQTVSTQNQTTAQHLSNLDTSVGGLTGSVTELQQAISGDGESFASKFERLSASADLAAIAAMGAMLSDEENQQENRKSKAEIQRDQSVLANEQEAQAQTIESMAADFNAATAELTAQIESEKTVRSNETTALAKSVSDMEASYKLADQTLTARIATEEQTRANAVEAVSQRVDQVLAATGDNTAAIQTEQTARANADEALAQSIQTVQASATSAGAAAGVAQTTADQAKNDAATAAGIANGKGKVLIQSTAPATADRLAQNLWIDTTSGANTPKRWNGSAWVAVTDKAATDAAAAAAAAQATADAAKLQATQNTAAIQTEQTARANADEALAQSIQTVQASIDETDASVETVAQAQATTAGKLAALWATKAQVNGAVSGFGLEVKLNADGSVVSSFIIDADIFAVLSRAAGATSTIHPFVIKNGVVYINKAMMDSADINQLIANYISVTELVGVVIRGAAIYGTNIFGGSLNIGSGKSLINSNGKATFQDVFISGGQINIGNGKAVINSDGSAYFEEPVISRNIVVDSGSLSVGNVISSSDWEDVTELMPLPPGYTDRGRKHRRNTIIAAMPFAQWGGTETYICSCSVSGSVSAYTWDSNFYGVKATLFPASRGYNTSKIYIQLDWESNGVISTSGLVINWKIYKVT